ncbi:single-stranded-DNA-specific exonuclease RecJ [Natronospira bacteriovora]|uniref:Single-stranded-DNA-specific exonuclease RecJ n=1 Tax=Natronospira bacteriovora TaxID=3069753 RepID=A0ABU0W3E2_9GAMM|nr:single-stranded-DNA-specific exonuclease RecJ [Natronospira sp. AB-CW4]MDQ2068308.1 single-stranded-DNA-specific exonuclease RecJ [Natronospira sp. AB-CW4]
MSVSSRIRRRQVADAARLPAHLHPVLRRLYAARGVRDKRELDYGSGKLLTPEALGGMPDAVALLESHLAGGRILVVGDFDADGATSTALLLDALRAMGAASVDYLVPNRFEYGYGLTPEIVALALGRPQPPTLIITVDNGISSLEGVALARERGVDVLVTDHHLPGPELPNANAILNPNLPGDDFPSRHLAGVGVVFYLLLGLRAHLRKRHWFAEGQRKEPRLADWLDLVALGTVADLVPLDHNNRILVHQGLERMRSGRLRPGIDALIRVAGRQRTDINCADLGFAVAPRLNAAGRLDDMSHGIETLLATDGDRAWERAQVLDAMNQRRRDIEFEMQQQAERAIDRLQVAEGEGLPSVVTLYRKDWHPGIVGLVASRIRERIHRPVAALARGENGRLKGSLRSVAGIHIRDVLADVDTRNPGLIERFGGHAMAAGLSLPESQLSRFRQQLEQAVDRVADSDALAGIVFSDGELPARDFTLEFAETLRRAGPWGQGFPEPLFDGVFHVLDSRIVGERHLKCRLQLPQVATPIEGIAFNPPAQWLDGLPEQVRLAYRLDVNEYRGLRRPQLVIEVIEAV